MSSNYFLPYLKTKFFLFLFLCCLVSQAQSFEEMLQMDDKELNEIIKREISPDSSTALLAAKVFLKKAKLEGNQENIFNGYRNIFQIHRFHVNMIESRKAADSLLSFANSSKNYSYRFSSYYISGHTYFSQGKMKKAVSDYEISLHIADSTKNVADQLKALSVLSNLYTFSEDFTTSIRLQHNAINRFKKYKKQLDSSQIDRMRIQLYGSLANSYLLSKKSDSCLKYTKLVHDEIILKKDTCLYKHAYRSYAQALILKEQYSKAKKKLDSSFNYCPPFNKQDSLILSGTYGKLYFGLGDFEKAVYYFEKSFMEYDIPEEEEAFMQDYYWITAKAYKEIGNLESANFYFEKYVNTFTGYNELKDELSINLKKREIDNFKNELNDLEKEKNQKDSFIKYLITVGGAVILGLLFLLLKFYRQKKNNEEKFLALLDQIEASKEQEIIDTKDKELDEKSSSSINSETTAQILEGLEKLKEQHYFLKHECNTYNVAKKIKTNTSYLSKVINSEYQKNFNTYINDLRINYTIVKLKEDKKFRSYSIQGIANEIGYKSADSFTKYFKLHTGLLPSFYIKKLNTLN